MSKYRVDVRTLEWVAARGGNDDIKAMATELLARRRDFAELLQAAREAIDDQDDRLPPTEPRNRLDAILHRHGA